MERYLLQQAFPLVFCNLPLNPYNSELLDMSELCVTKWPQPNFVTTCNAQGSLLFRIGGENITVDEKK